jgi:hypothetical protein
MCPLGSFQEDFMEILIYDPILSIHQNLTIKPGIKVVDTSFIAKTR